MRNYIWGGVGVFLGAAFVLALLALLQSPSLSSLADGIASSATLAATLIGLGFAWKGLETWRVQLRGTARFDACRQFLEDVVKLREAIATFRSPWMLSGEQAAAFKARGRQLTVNDGDEGYSLAMIDRWGAVQKEIVACNAHAVPLEVLLGGHVVEVMLGLRRVVGELLVAFDAERGRRATRAFGREDRRTIEEMEKENEPLIDFGLGRPNAFTDKLQAALKQAEDLVAEHVRERFT